MRSASAVNSRPGAAAERRACAGEKRTCAPRAERSERKVFCGTSAGRTRFLFKKASTLPLTLWARSQKGTRETAKRFSRTAAYREGGFPKAGLRASAPHNSVSPRRRLYQRAAHALGGVTGKLGGNLRGIEDAIKKPPARVSYGKQSTGLFSYFPALAGAIRPWDAVPHPASFLSRKLGKELYPPTARTCTSSSMSTSGASCPRRDLPGVQPPRIESPGTGPPAEDRKMRQLPKKLGFMRVSQSISYETQ